MRLRRPTHASRPHTTGAGDPAEPELAQVVRRLEHLEKEFEGLQDAMHREFVRQHKQIDELIKSTQPAAVARALSDDARRRGV
jgi:hypothetical protein